MPFPGEILPVVVATGQSNGSGTAAVPALPTAPLSYVYTLSVPTLLSGETGLLDGSVMLSYRLAVAGDYTGLILFQQQTRNRFVRDIVSPGHFTGTPVLDAQGETPLTSFFEYLHARYPTQKYGFIDGALTGCDYSRIRANTDPFTNGMTMLTAMKVHAMALGYAGIKVVYIIHQHGESDAGWDFYANETVIFQQSWTTSLQAITGQTEIPRLVQIQMNAPDDTVVPLLQVTATTLSPYVGLALPAYFLPQNGFHRTNLGQQTSGQYWARDYDRVDLQGLPAMSLRFQSATFSQNVIRVSPNRSYAFTIPLKYKTTDVVAANPTKWGFNWAYGNNSIVGVSVAGDGQTLLVRMANANIQAGQILTYALVPAPYGAGNVVDSDDQENWALRTSLTVTPAEPPYEVLYRD